MKICKKMLAILLCMCTVLSVTVFSGSANDALPQYASVRITSARAVKWQEDDPQTVLQLELGIDAYPSADPDAGMPMFDVVDTDAQIVIYEGLYIAVSNLISPVLKSEKDKVFDETVVATAKAVSYAEGILTVDVFSESGEPGAKMISILAEGFEDTPVCDFWFKLPLGLLTDSSTGVTNSGVRMRADVEGLQSVPLDLPLLLRWIVKNYVSGNTARAFRILLFFPLTPILIPILLYVLRINAQQIYDLYGIDLSGLFTEGRIALRKRIPYLYGLIF